MESTCKAVTSYDQDTFNRLLLSMGHLKFSMRALAAEGVQGAVLASEECEIPSFEVPAKANSILENIISEVTATPVNNEGNTVKTSKGVKLSSSNKSSIENLQMVRDKLQRELENIRLYHQSILSEKLEKKKNDLPS